MRQLRFFWGAEYMEDFLKVGAVTATHGVRGEVRVFPTTDDPGRFRSLEEVILQKNGLRETHEIRSVKFSKNMVILGLSGINSMNDAEKYRNWDLMVPREKAVPLGEDEYYIGDLIGMEVVTKEGCLLGHIEDVMQTGANDVYVVSSEEYGEILIPAIKACIIQVDVNENRMTAELLPGLLPER